MLFYSGGAANPYYQCMPGTATATGGVWGGAVFECIGTHMNAQIHYNVQYTVLLRNFDHMCARREPTLLQHIARANAYERELPHALHKGR